MIRYGVSKVGISSKNGILVVLPYLYNCNPAAAMAVNTLALWYTFTSTPDSLACAIMSVCVVAITGHR